VMAAQRFHTTAICPAGPPKDSRPICIQARVASEKETGGWEITGVRVSDAR
jgi:hypothetical protein